MVTAEVLNVKILVNFKSIKLKTIAWRITIDRHGGVSTQVWIVSLGSNPLRRCISIISCFTVISGVYFTLFPNHRRVKYLFAVSVMNHVSCKARISRRISLPEKSSTHRSSVAMATWLIQSELIKYDVCEWKLLGIYWIRYKFNWFMSWGRATFCFAFTARLDSSGRRPSI